MPTLCDSRRVAVGLGGGGDLRADLSGGAGLGVDHDRLLEDRLQGGGQRPRHDVVEPAGRKRVDDGDGTRGISLLRECRSGRERGRGGSDDETTTIHALLLWTGMSWLIPKPTGVFASIRLPARPANCRLRVSRGRRPPQPRGRDASRFTSFLCQANLHCLRQLDAAKLPGPVAQANWNRKLSCRGLSTGTSRKKRAMPNSELR